MMIHGQILRPASIAEDVEDFEERDEWTACPVCGGEGLVLGQLGSRTHFRCRDCGMDFSVKQ